MLLGVDLTTLESITGHNEINVMMVTDLHTDQRCRNVNLVSLSLLTLFIRLDGTGGDIWHQTHHCDLYCM